MAHFGQRRAHFGQVLINDYLPGRRFNAQHAIGDSGFECR